MNSCQPPIRGLLLVCFVAVLLSTTVAFVHDRSYNACFRIQHRRADDAFFRRGGSSSRDNSSLRSSPSDHNSEKEKLDYSNTGEEIQDAYGRTIVPRNDGKCSNAQQQQQQQHDVSLDDPLAETAKAGKSESGNEKNVIEMNLDPLVICGPSGVGKGTVIQSLRKRFQPDVFGFSVSHTTRQPRPGEVHGEHYFFTTLPEIKDAIDKNLFVEHAEVHGNYYGTSKQAITNLQEEQKVTILDIDVQGVKSVKESGIVCKYVFIAPPSMAELEARLRGRGTETEEAIWKRLGNAASEMEYGSTKGNFDKIFVNQDVESTVDEMVEVFLEWFPQLKAAILPPVKEEQPFDFLAESDKMMRFPSVRKGHDKLEVQDLGEQHNRARANGNHHGYYTVDLEEPEGPRGYPKLGKTNPNIVLDGQDVDEDKAY